MILPRSVSYELCRKSYQFRHMLKHVNMNPPNIMPEKMASKPLPDNQNQAPIIPPVAMLASNQKIQVRRLFIGGAVRPPILVAQTLAKTTRPLSRIRGKVHCDKSYNPQ
jgi:hypothetical protein